MAMKRTACFNFRWKAANQSQDCRIRRSSRRRRRKRRRRRRGSRRRRRRIRRRRRRRRRKRRRKRRRRRRRRKRRRRHWSFGKRMEVACENEIFTVTSTPCQTELGTFIPVRSRQ
jgi:hypothetical protein